MVFLGINLGEYIYKRKESVKLFFENPEENMKKFIKKVQKKIKNQEYNPFSHGLDVPMYEVIDP